MTQFARESFTGRLIDEIEPLCDLHWREVAHYPDIPLEPDWSVYAGAERAGTLRVFTVRDERALYYGKPQLVGYAVFFVRANPHYASSLQAVQDILFVLPEVRGSVGYRFLKWCDEQLRAEGVQAVYHHVKQAHNFGRLLERQGYELVDLIYAKRLDR